MGAISATDIISIIQGEIENINWDEQSRETGEVIWVGDGIVTVYGIDHAMYGEIVAFENGVKGMVQDVRQNEIGVEEIGIPAISEHLMNVIDKRLARGESDAIAQVLEEK